MTEKLYYLDSHMREFSSSVLACGKCKKGYEVTLQRTAFFPEGGGEPCDTGYIGSVRVIDVFERGEDVIHVTDSPVEPGNEYSCVIDWDKRIRSMRHHTAEHIISGIVHSMYGYENVGYHLGADGVIIDFSGFLTKEEIAEVEKRSNEAVMANVPIKCWFPDSEVLSSISYRSKLDLTENVRIVDIEGVDTCACCAMHVKRTGEIGLIKIHESIHRHDGVRMRMTAGLEAYSDYREKYESIGKISALLSAKACDTANAVEKFMNDKAAADRRCAELSRRLAELMAENPCIINDNIVFFESLLDADGLRCAVNAAMPKCSGICAAFSGNDSEGYKYIMGSVNVDMRAEAKTINAALKGRGGGQTTMIQGSLSSSRTEIEEFFKNR